MLVFQTLSEFQVTVAFVAVPVSSSRLNGDALRAPAALFQLLLAITPAVSELPINEVLLPTKSMPIVPCPGVKLVTKSVTDLVCARLPLVPVMVNMYDPSAVLLAVVMLTTEDPFPATAAGLKVSLAPVGKPLMLRLTLFAKPFNVATLTV